MVKLRAEAFARSCGGIACLGATGVLLGWIFRIEILKSVIPGLSVMKVNTAIGMMMSGIMLLILARDGAGSVRRAIAGGLSMAVFVLGAVTLSEYFWGWDAGIDQALFVDTMASDGPTSAGRMSASTAFCFLLAGAAFWTASRANVKGTGYSLVSGLGVNLIAIGGMASLGHIVNVLFDLHLWNYFGMAVPTALGFVVVGCGVLAMARSREGVAGWALGMKTSMGFAVSIAAMLTVAGVSWNQTTLLKEAAAWVSHTRLVLKEIEDLRADVAELESSQRGYVLLGKEELLVDRKATRERVKEHVGYLGKLMADNAYQKPRVDQLGELVGWRTAFGERTIEMRREKGFTAAQELIATGEGIALSKQIERVLGVMRNEEYELLGVRESEAEAISKTTFLILPLGVFVSLTVLMLAVFSLNRGIGEREIAELKLQASLKDVKDLTTALDEHAIVAVTDHKGKITYVNDKFCAISKYSREELIGKDHRIINSGHHPKEFIRDLWKTITRGDVWHGQLKNRAKDGGVYWVDTTIVPFLDEAGKPRQFVAIRADITESKRAQEEIERLNASLEQRVKERTAELEAANKELGAFSYSVSHDLRAPLRAVDGFSQAVMEDYGDLLPEDGKKYLQTIRDGAQRMGMLIDDLLAFSRLSRSPLSKQEVNTREHVLTVLESLSHLREGREVEIKLGDLPMCEASPSMIDQVWVNLISNALKYTRQREKAVVEIGCETQNGERVYFVKDNGAGFDMRYANKLFGVFQRLHRAEEFEGTGVGLAIVQRIVHRHGGRIWADAEIGRGATFYFTLKEKVDV